MPKRTPVPDLVRPVAVGGLFFVLGILIAGLFLLENTRLLMKSAVPANSNTSAPADLFNAGVLVEVDAKGGWQMTNLLAKEGADITITVVDGQWTAWEGVSPYTAGAGSDYVCADAMPAERCVEPVPDFPVGTLIGRIGRQILRIGEGSHFTVKRSGLLMLRINDGDPGLHDNAGKLVVEILIK
ncbi:MAG TPA: hypothetical protein VGJ22_01855 [Anaerolineales bacterium]|jgi:hypothetical protein